MANVDSMYSEDDLLYYNNLGRKSFQWELWQCCNNLCSFCYLGHDNRCTNKERQLKSLCDLKKSLEKLDFNEYNNVSLIGGEFFQGQLEDVDVRRGFYEIIEMLCDLYSHKKIGSIWITATLTLGDQADMYKMLEMFDKAGVVPHPKYGASGVWICTSWDAQGRFHTKKAENNWEFHMKNMQEKYPWIKKNTTIILSQKLCEMYLANEFSPKNFMKDFKTFLFFKNPGITQQFQKGSSDDETDSPNLYKAARDGKIDEFLMNVKKEIEKDLGYRFFPDRKTFRKFLVKYAREDADTFDRLFNIEFRADELHRNFNDSNECDNLPRNKNSNIEGVAGVESIINPNCLLEPESKKHVIYYETYIDSHACMICDRDQIWRSVNC